MLYAEMVDMVEKAKRIPAGFIFLMLMVLPGCYADREPGDGHVDTMGELEGQDAVDQFIDEDHADWSACEVIGEYCLPTDTMIVATDCMPDENGTIRFGSWYYCIGDCMCGFVRETYPCDEWMHECSDATAAPFQYGYCATGRRILCSHGFYTRAIVRVGCCDEAGYVYCERDPRPDSNICQ